MAKGVVHVAKKISKVANDLGSARGNANKNNKNPFKNENSDKNDVIREVNVMNWVIREKKQKEMIFEIIK